MARQFKPVRFFVMMGAAAFVVRAAQWNFIGHGLTQIRTDTTGY